MRFDIALLQARRHENQRRVRMWRVVRAAGGSLAVGCAGLIFGFTMGLHDARWSEAWTHVGAASLPFSGAQAIGITAHRRLTRPFVKRQASSISFSGAPSLWLVSPFCSELFF